MHSKDSTETKANLSALHNTPLVSIIIAVYNADRYLEQCIKSILEQDYRHFELIIIDGGSTDNSVNIIKKYEDNLKKWISEPDKGIYDAWNKGLSLAKGDWIAFVGADDILYPNALQSYVDHIKSHPDSDKLEFVSSQIELVEHDLTPIRIVGEKWEWSKFRVSMITWHVGSFHARKLFDKYGLFNADYKVSGDYELLLRPKESLITSYVPEILAKMRTGGVSAKRLWKAIEETYQAKVSNTGFPLWKARLLTIVDKVRVKLK